MSAMAGKSKLTRTGKIVDFFLLRERGDLFFNVGYQSFQCDSDEIRIQKRVITLKNTFKAKCYIAINSPYITMLNEFSSFKIFFKKA